MRAKRFNSERARAVINRKVELNQIGRLSFPIVGHEESPWMTQICFVIAQHDCLLWPSELANRAIPITRMNC